MIFALGGNQNSGKTTLFNQLTGSNQHVGELSRRHRGGKKGNHPESPGRGAGRPAGNLFPLPLYQRGDRHPGFSGGTASDGIINIVDATNIERNLYLTPTADRAESSMVIALNMMDEIRNNGSSIDVQKLPRRSGCRWYLSPPVKTRAWTS